MGNLSLRTRALLALALMPLLFSTNIVIGRALVQEVPPFTLSAIRWSIASGLTALFIAPALRQHWPAIREAWRTVFLLGFLSTSICGALVYASLKLTTAINATLIYCSSTLMIALIDRALGGPRLTPLRIAGIALGFLGVVAIVTRGHPEILASIDLNIGDLAILVVALGWAGYSLILGRSAALQKLPTQVVFASVAAAGVALLLPGAMVEMALLGPFPMTLEIWGSILALAVFPSILAFATYQYGVAVVGPTVAGMFLYFMPVHGIALAVLFLGETPAWYHAVGLVLVLAGVFLATSQRTPPAKENAA